MYSEHNERKSCEEASSKGKEEHTYHVPWEEKKQLL